LVTVTSRTPVAAFPPIVMVAVSDLPLFATLVTFAVIPGPNETVAPVANPVPLTVMVWFVAPWPREFGAVEVTVGPAFTVKQPVHVAVP
jgi:hypothetical protein